MRNEILLAMEGVLGEPPGLLLVHSSLAKLAPDAPFTKWDFLFAIRKLVDRGWTIAFPSFTFSFTKTKYFSISESGSETGILADWVHNEFADALRTLDPIYSFVVIGCQADEVLICQSKTTFGDSSPFSLFEQKNATVCLLGASWNDCTQFHRYEEMASVPYRYFKTFDGVQQVGDQKLDTQTKMFVRDLDLAFENDFSPLIEQLESDNCIRSVKLARGKVQSAYIRDIRDIAMSQLSSDPLIYVKDRKKSGLRLSQRVARESQDDFHVAILGSSNLDSVASHFQSRINEDIGDRKTLLYVAPFGQLANQILDQCSELSQFNAELTFFVDRLEDLLGTANAGYHQEGKILKAVENYASLIKKFVSSNKGTVVVHWLTSNTASCLSDQKELTVLTRRCNYLLEEYFLNEERIIWFDVTTEVKGHDDVSDPRTWYLGRFPFRLEIMERLAERWSSIAMASLGKMPRLIVVDLDNTLWGGVIGEDGIDGIKLGGDYPGNCFSDFQLTLQGLAKKGVAIAVCSKNDEDVALDVFDRHAYMVLSSNDIVTHRINWLPKYQNIQSIAAELSLGLESILFIDDNPVERASVRNNLPGVKVLDLPQDPALYTTALSQYAGFEILAVTELDAQRTASYKSKAKIDKGIESAENIESFLADLDIEVFIQLLSEHNIDRAAQMCVKTNQFNTTTKRYSASDLYELQSNGDDVFIIGAQDTFTSRENIGLFVLKRDRDCDKVGTIDLFLLSCRVLGRGIETAVIEWCISRAHRLGWTSIFGKLLETERNTPVRTLFSNNGFSKSEFDELWVRENMSSNLPAYITLRDETNGI